MSKIEDRPKILSINTRYYPTQASTLGHEGLFGIDQSDTPPPTVAVLVAGDIEDYAVYVGYGAPEWVARHGDKISFDEAVCHFPIGLKRENYRS